MEWERRCWSVGLMSPTIALERPTLQITTARGARTMGSNGTRTTRRAFLASMAGAAAAAPSLAQSLSIDEFLNAKGRGNWDDELDGRRSQPRGQVVSRQPIFSPQTAMNIERAIVEYRRIADNGGWPIIPTAEKLRVGMVSKNVRYLRRRLVVSGDLPKSASEGDSFDTYVDQAVKRFQTRHGATADGVVGTYTYKALNVPVRTRVGQLETNLIRLRQQEYQTGNRFVMVNIPAAQIEAVGANGRVESRHTAVVGKIDRQTPILSSKIFEFNLNPYWTSPVSIVRKDIIPLMRKDPKYLEKNAIRIFDRSTGAEIPPSSIDWNTEEAVDFMFRQDPGKINAMGSVKINFPNPHAVYMHDTPQQTLFSKLLRFESSGCVRVQNVRDLLVWLANETPNWSRSDIEQTIASGARIDVQLAQPVPLHFTYISAWSTDPGVVHFRDDIYRLDGSAELALQR